MIAWSLRSIKKLPSDFSLKRRQTIGGRQIIVGSLLRSPPPQMKLLAKPSSDGQLSLRALLTSSLDVGRNARDVLDRRNACGQDAAGPR